MATTIAVVAPALLSSAGLAQQPVDPPADPPPALGEAATDAVLSRPDRARYGRIFESQQAGRWDEADALIDQLDDRLLLGHVLAQRYLHPTAYSSRFDELHDWLVAYPDLPQAATIYRLAQKRRPAGAAELPLPIAGYLAGSGQELIEDSGTDRLSGDHRSAEVSADEAADAWLAKIESLVAADALSEAAAMLSEPPASAGDLASDLAHWKLAKGYFANRQDGRAFEVAVQAAASSGPVEPRIHWTAGLAAWRAERLDDAQLHFSALAASDGPRDAVTAGAYWAARVLARLNDIDGATRWLEQAAASPDDFYGQLALERLGRSPSIARHGDGRAPDLSALASAHAGVRRALALSAVGRDDLAAREIRKLAARAGPELTAALATLAAALNLPATQMRVAQRLLLQGALGDPGVLYPVPSWRPPRGFAIDRALLFALIRAESGFDPHAMSYANARGLMQILPATADGVVADLVDDQTPIAYAGPDALFDPVTNIAIGQAYVAELLENPLVGGSLLRMVIAYNAGLTRLGDWLPRYADLEDDPLLLIESIPVPETRRHIKKVLSNLWVYRARLGQDWPSLKLLAADDWPDYQPIERIARYARAD